MGGGRGSREGTVKGPRGQGCCSHRVRRRNSCGQQTGWARKSGRSLLAQVAGWVGKARRPALPAAWDSRVFTG